jgi:LPXTG-motif cell wall-anchored protein
VTPPVETPAPTPTPTPTAPSSGNGGGTGTGNGGTGTGNTDPNVDVPTLPVTGTDVTSLVTAGGLLTLGGMALVLTGRRRRVNS